MTLFYHQKTLPYAYRSPLCDFDAKHLLHGWKNDLGSKVLQHFTCMSRNRLYQLNRLHNFYKSSEPEDKGETETATGDRYECAACGWVYDEGVEDVPFDELPEDYTCPVCGSDKEDFYKL